MIVGIYRPQQMTKAQLLLEKKKFLNQFRALTLLVFLVPTEALGKEQSIHGSWNCDSSWETEDLKGYDKVKILISENHKFYRQTGESEVQAKNNEDSRRSTLSYKASFEFEYIEPKMISTSHSFEIIRLSDELNFFERASLESLDKKGHKMISTLTFFDSNTLISESESGIIYKCVRNTNNGN